MQIISYDNNKFEDYKNNLKLIGSLSLLFSESDDPWLDYRVPENLYCECFGAENLARSCVTADAKLGDIITLLDDKDNDLSLDNWAKIVGTINYELPCRLKVRLPRVYTR